MKKILLILLCLPILGFGQTAKEYYIEGLLSYLRVGTFNNPVEEC